MGSQRVGHDWATQWEPLEYGPVGGREGISCPILLPFSGCLELHAKASLSAALCFHSAFSGIGFLSLDTIDILGRIILHCMDLFNSIPGLYPLDVNNISQVKTI